MFSFWSFIILKVPNRDAEIILKCENLFSNIDSGFIAIVKDLMKKYGLPLIDHLKVLLECSICKGLINKVYNQISYSLTYFIGFDISVGCFSQMPAHFLQ